ncbi:helix-turn-helix domain-containing protein [Singulisphaera sp. PoT]|uniref:helix-turn-helix domain-containing protein n=1 Tax=Singulisphaera sp. PoT TaxID=3411797 RepID=UPI003BF50D83
MPEPFKLMALKSGDVELIGGFGLRRTSSLQVYEPTLHAHDFHQVTVVLSCSRAIEWKVGDDGAFSGLPKEGDVVICPARVHTLVRLNRSFESISLRISTDMLDRAARRAGRTPGSLRPLMMRRDDFVCALARRLDDADAETRGLLAEPLGKALTLHLLREYAEDSHPRRGEARLSPEDLRRVVGHVDDHLGDDLSLGRLAAIAGLSPHHFLRRFRAAMGKTPHRFVIERRVERARELLVNGSGIAEASLRVGFSSQSHLHRHIRRLLGVTPGELARRQSLTNQHLR